MSFSYTIPADTYFAATKEEANAIARAAAEALALRVKFCCEIPDINGCVGEVMSKSYDVSLGTGPFTWSVTAGTLPAGLAISLTNGGRTMTLSGTPTATGNATITLTITDSNGEYIDKTFEIQIIGITNASLADAQVGVAYSVQLTAAGGSGSYYFELTAGALPAGLSLSSSGLISGTPTTAEVASFTISLSDQAVNNPITGTLDVHEKVDSLLAVASFRNHSYLLEDFTTLFATIPPVIQGTVPLPRPAYPVWDGNLPVSSDCPYLYSAGAATWKFPGGSEGPAIKLWAYANDGTFAVGKPIAFWRMRIEGEYYIVGYPDAYWWVLWEGICSSDKATGEGDYIRSSGYMTTPAQITLTLTS